MSEVLPPVVIVGLGELGSVFARGLLRLGHPVVPVLRSTPVAALSEAHPDPALVLVAVGEDDLAPALGDLPPQWLSRVALVQNELLPGQWEAAGVEQPTVAVVWFEKKAGKEPHDVVPTVLAGPRANLLARCLEGLGIAHRLVPETELLHELVAKNLYILVLNLAGLLVEGTAGDLLTVHRATLDALGLNRFGKTVYIKDTPANRGMLYSVVHLVTVEPREGEPPAGSRAKARAASAS